MVHMVKTYIWSVVCNIFFICWEYSSDEGVAKNHRPQIWCIEPWNDAKGEQAGNHPREIGGKWGFPSGVYMVNDG